MPVRWWAVDVAQPLRGAAGARRWTACQGIGSEIRRTLILRWHPVRMPLVIRPATVDDVPLILTFIRGLAEFENLAREVTATEERLRATLYPTSGHPAAECVLAFADDTAAGFALFFSNYSTFLAKPGLYLEDLFVTPELRGRGIGKALLLHLAKLAVSRDCGRLEWTVLDWNHAAIGFYESIGAQRMRDWQICRLAGAALEQYR
jgi:GNAT superfamily N-acetyltransferase